MPAQPGASPTAAARQRAQRRIGVLLVVAALVVAAVLAIVVAKGADSGGRKAVAAPTSSPASGTTAPAPSTGPPPAPPGWKVLWQDDFTAPKVDVARWFEYSGEPSGGPGAWWEPSHVLQAGGVLTLRGVGDPARGGQLVTAGLNSSSGPSYAYGRYLVRMRVTPSPRVAYGVLLVSPKGPGGGGYLRVASDNGGNRHELRAGLTTTSLSGAPLTLDRSTKADLTRWHVVGVDWTPGRLTYTLDGRPWSTITSSLTPATPLALALQTQAVCDAPATGRCHARSGETIDMQVDWVSVMAADVNG